MFIIGERINPAGKSSLASAIREGKENVIQEEAQAQERAGADRLDLQVYLPDLDRRKAIKMVVESVRSVSHLPLVIDERDPEIVAAGLQAAGMNASINSPIDCQADARIFSLAKESKAETFFLPLNQNRIPLSTEEHLETSGFILKRFEEHGIPKNRIVIDAMGLALKQVKRKAIDVLERIKRLKAELGIQTVMGLSNISYGLKDRSELNARFLKLAQGCGLDFVICDPLQKEVMAVARAKAEMSSQAEMKEFFEFAETCWA
ncbi:MAG: dihydropteroate synthase [Candidatus Omnitrophica bacterium]|nr:dihydropteroate synthase [Candidatus Omnitrophota bacterium]